MTDLEDIEKRLLVIRDSLNREEVELQKIRDSVIDISNTLPNYNIEKEITNISKTIDSLFYMIRGIVWLIWIGVIIGIITCWH